jgi:hypothetical protein
VVCGDVISWVTKKKWNAKDEKGNENMFVEL